MAGEKELTRELLKEPPPDKGKDQKSYSRMEGLDIGVWQGLGLDLQIETRQTFSFKKKV